MKTDNIATGIIGIPVDSITGEQIELEEHEHFYICVACGQSVDKRDLGQVFHHEENGHMQIKIDD